MKNYLHICFVVFIHIVNLINYIVDLKTLEFNFDIYMVKLTTPPHPLTLPMFFFLWILEKHILHYSTSSLSYYESIVLSQLLGCKLFTHVLN